MPEVNESKYFVTVGMKDVPHLDDKARREIEANTPLHLRAARMNGEPSLGAGAVYRVSPDDFRVRPFQVPEHFSRGYGFDPGWNRTAAIWGAHDRESDILYLISEHYGGQSPPSVHADAIKARGIWQPGIADYAGRDIDGKRVIDQYRGYDLNLQNADKSVEAGIMAVTQRLESGRLRVFSTLQHWFDEYRFYIRSEKTGQIVKKNDHLMDATRYLVMSIAQMKTRPIERAFANTQTFRPLDSEAGY